VINGGQEFGAQFAQDKPEGSVSALPRRGFNDCDGHHSKFDA